MTTPINRGLTRYKTIILTKNGLISLTILVSYTVSGCSTLSDSLIVGVGTGAAAGAVVASNLNGGRSEQALTGAAIGAAMGALGSYLIYGGLQKRDYRVRRETLLNLERYDVSGVPPTTAPIQSTGSSTHMLTKPTVDVEWIDTRVDGGKLIEGHRVWRVTDNPKWIPGDSSKPKQK